MDNLTLEDEYCAVCGTTLDIVSMMDGSPICDSEECEDAYQD
jgi:predicted nucleic acid-binding Zn ribbon protein